MSKTQTLQIRIDEQLKKKASKTLRDLGMDLSSGVQLFLTQLVREQGLPFQPTKDLKQLRKKWDKEAAESKKSGQRFTDIESLRASLLSK